MSSPRPGLSLAWKVYLALAAVVLTGLAVFALLANRVAAREVHGFMFRGGMTDLTGLANELGAYYRGHGSWDGVEALFDSRFPGRGPMAGEGPPGSGGMMGGPGMAAMMNPPLTLAGTDGSVIASNVRDPGEILDSQAMLGAVPIAINGRTVGVAVAEGWADTSTLGLDLISRVGRSIGLMGWLIGGVALLAGGLLVTSLLRPVRALTAAARGLARGDLGTRVPVRTGDELGQLSAAFNQMAESLQRAEHLRREMTADIAHELRNPLAVMQARLEATLDGVYPTTPESLEPVLDQARLLNRLVEDLRTLALADAGQITLDRGETDLRALAVRVVANHAEQGRAKQISLRVVPDTASLDAGSRAAAVSVSAFVDPARMEQILGNLLSNALRHTPPGGEVQVLLERNPARREVTVSVADSGEGIPPESLPLIFERFYRGDRARSRGEGGSGLGLSIARRLVEAHGGTISAANRPEGGAIFIVVLPSGMV